MATFLSLTFKAHVHSVLLCLKATAYVYHKRFVR